MTLHTHWFLRLESAADRAAALLRSAPPGDPFAADVLVVGGRGVEQWLRRALVERLDILTNVQVWSPSRFVSDLERWAVPSAGGGAARLTLAILAAVSRDSSLLPPGLEHLDPGMDDGTGARAPAGPMLLTWASRMARTYERYALHRHHWLADWEANRAAPASMTVDDWQARLWRAVGASAREAGQQHTPAAVHVQTVERLRAASASDLPPRWIVLHQGRLSRVHMSLLTALSVHHEVHVLVHAATQPLLQLAAQPPSQGDEVDTRAWVLQAQHEVASRLDRVRVEGVMLLRRAVREHGGAHQPAIDRAGDHASAAAIDHVSETDALRENAPPASLLHVAQRHARASADSLPAVYTPAQRANDDSLRVMACHGLLRQVEVVKDALLGALNADASLQPRDVLILTPDPSRFVPLLQAVFPLTRRVDGNHTEAPGLALFVQGRTPRTTNPVADVMLRLLSLADERVTASGVLSLVERGPVAEMFGLSPADAPVIRALMRESGVRWGIDAADAQREGLGLTDEGTWRRGMTRLMLGVAMLDPHDDTADESVHVRGHGPVPGLEGERALLAGRAVRAVRVVLDILVAARDARPIAAWEAFVRDALQLLVRDDGNASTSATRLRDIMQSLAADAESSNGKRNLTASALAQLLEHRMDDPVVSPGRVGAITVAPLVPGWVYPARVIVLLGMDDGAFPTRGGAPWFDRLADHPQIGDPDERGEQLQTVFDALLCAGDQLLITYTGWNRAGTMRLPPGVPVGAIEQLVKSVVPVSDAASAWKRLVEREMPLQPFSVRAFSDNAPAVRSFDAMSAEIASALQGAPRVRSARSAATAEHIETPADAHSVRTLPLATLLRFLRAPASEILSRLGVWGADDEILTDDVLPLTLDRRAESGVVVELAQAQLRRGDDSRPRDALRHHDVMPPARLGAAWLRQAELRAAWLVDQARDAIDGAQRAESEVLRVRVGNTILTGSIDSRYGDTLLFMRDGKNNDLHLLRPFVTLAFAVAAGASVRRAVLIDAEERTTLNAPQLDASRLTPGQATGGDTSVSALDVLRTCLDLYHDADRDVPPFAPRTSLAYIKQALKGDEADALYKAEQVWNPLNGDGDGECADAGNALLHHVPPVGRPGFASIAHAIFDPMLDAVEGP